MALVGIAFAVGFTLGPSIGAYFASLPLEAESSAFAYAPFATAAVFSLGLLVLESAYLYANLPETLDFKHSAEAKEDEGTSELPASSGGDRHVAKMLRRLNWTHFAYLFFFSGMEYTLTFLTHDKFDFSNAQQGKLLGFIGIVSTVIQGGYVRRVKSRSGSRDKALVAQGMAGCALGLLSIAICAFKAETTGYSAPSWWLWAGSFGFAVASATVVNCLNSMVSLAGSQGMAPKDTGKRLGDFRSAGQIGRALGPMFACSVYWLSGAAVCYLIGAIAVAAITTVFVSTIPSTITRGAAKAKTS
ncbi:hypothetical protein EC988_002326 [Linderina pennispora]|nr:hypothetical protein EC988_002326 [Linderina pennispora]